MVSPNGSREKDIVDVPEFKLGQVKGSGYKFLVARGGGDGTDGEFAGILGQDLLSAYDIELDPTENRVNFFLPNPCDGKAVYWWDEHFELPLQFQENRRQSRMLRSMARISMLSSIPSARDPVSISTWRTGHSMCRRIYR